MSSPQHRFPLWLYVSEYRHAKGRVALAAFLAAVKHSPVIFIPMYTAYVLDRVIPAKDMTALLLCFVGMASLILINICLHPLYIRLYSRVRREVAVRLRARLCERIQQLVFAYHDSSQSGRLHSKVMQDVEKLDALGQIFIDPLFVFLLTAFAASTIVILREPSFAIILLVFVPAVILLIQLLRKKLEEKHQQLRVEQEKLNAEVGEMISMLTLTRAHATEHQDLRRVGARLGSVLDVGVRTDWITNILSSQIWAVSQLISVIVVCFGGYLVMQAQMTVGEVVMFMFFIGMTVGSISGILNNIGMFYAGNEAMRSISEVLNHPAIEENDGKPELPPLVGRIAFRDVWFSYPGNSRPVLKSLDLEVEPNQVIALVGGSGAGKTTFVKLLLGFYRPMQGEIHVDGQAMSGFNLRSLRRQIGIVTQDTFLFNGTIYQNLSHGLEDADFAEVEEAARQANALQFIAELEKGFDTEIGDRGVRLSGGQKQRLAIARAILRKPRLLILDEATSALDSESELLVQQALEVLMRGRTTFVIAHRLSTIRNADRILVFDDGRIVEDGRHDLLLRQGGVYARLVNLQAVG